MSFDEACRYCCLLPRSCLSRRPARSIRWTTTSATKVSDPYRWMEDVDAPEVKEWIDEENRLTRSVLDGVAGRACDRAASDGPDQLRTLHGSCAPRNTLLLLAQHADCRIRTSSTGPKGLNGEPNVLLDPNTMSADGTVAISGLSVSDDGRLASLLDRRCWLGLGEVARPRGCDGRGPPRHGGLVEVQLGLVAQGWLRLLLRGLRCPGRGCAEGDELLPQDLLSQAGNAAERRQARSSTGPTTRR